MSNRERNIQHNTFEPPLELRPNCPTCDKPGQITSLKDGAVKVFCITCRIDWISQTETCTECGEPNGYVHPGPCVHCYKQKKGVA